MQIFKKLFFAIPFLVLFYLATYSLAPIVKNVYGVFNFSLETFLGMVLALIFLALSLICYLIFQALAQDYRLVLPVIGVACFAPAVYFPLPLSYLIVGGFLVSFGIIYYLLEKRLKGYLTFEASPLLHPSLKMLSGLIFLTLTLAYFSIATQEIKKNGFQIPDALIEAALKVASPQVQGMSISKDSSGHKMLAQLPTISKEQIEFLKKNPALLKQYNIDPEVLNNIGGSTEQSHEVSPKTDSPLGGSIKDFLNAQLQKVIEPYLKYMPFILSALFFVTLQTLFSLLIIFVPLVFWLIFYILEKTNFVHFEKEMREVKKLVV